MFSTYGMASLRTLAGAGAIAWSSLAMPQALAAEQHDSSVVGQWTLTAVLDSADVSGLDDEEARRLVGSMLKISKDKVRVGGQVCGTPDFETVSGDRDEYLERRAHASAERLGLPNPVTSVHINCAYVYKKTPDRMVLNWQGVFFEAVRQKRRRKN